MGRVLLQRIAPEGTHFAGGREFSRIALLCAGGDEVAKLDPLGADATFTHLPAWNAAGDSERIALALVDATPSRAQVARMTTAEAAASLRDLGMLASSLMRHGVDFSTVIPELERRLIELGALVEMVPRDTVYHYGVWNPSGPRERSFTGEPGEAALIAAARTAAPAIDGTLYELIATLAHPIRSQSFADGCQRAAHRLAEILCSIGKAKKEIPPLFFARTLRPYFIDLRIGGEKFAGASAAPLSVCIVDHILWSSDCEDQAFSDFQSEQIRYNLPHWRRLYAATRGQPSLVTRLREMITRGRAPPPEVISAVTELLQVLLIFRGRHRYVAMRAYDESIRLYDVGSGGHGTSTLEHLFALTRDAFRSLRSTAPSNGDTP
ncbi:MAG: DUF1864 family protein [Nannocystaceae bacterium]